MIVDCVADLHGHYPKLEGGDLLIVAGDLTAKDTYEQMLEFCRWTMCQKYRKVVFIAGNHDHCLIGNRSMHRGPSEDIGRPEVAYLFDCGIEFEGLKIWGSPWTLWFKGINPKCTAFTVKTEEELGDKFQTIPSDVDILITHSPPWNVLDRTDRGENVGSRYLRGRLEYCFRPKLWVWGHVHEAYGMETFRNTTICVNASHVNGRYEPVNKPVRVVL